MSHDLFRFSHETCMTTLSTRADGRRTKSANGRNRERWATTVGSGLYEGLIGIRRRW